MKVFSEQHKINLRTALMKDDYKIKHSKKSLCPICKNIFLAYTKQQLCCTQKCKYQYELKTKYGNPIAKKAYSISGSISIGGGKRIFFENFIKEHIRKKCVYCGDILSLDNISIDHIEPFRSTKVRRGKEYLGIKKYFDRKENLQIICRKCNKLKSDFNHVEFSIFLDFLNKNIKIKEKIIKRLARSDIMWSFKRA